jgi:hypothetical protein
MTDIDTDLSTYLANHQRRMTEALKTANENIHKKVSARQQLMNGGTDNTPIEIGPNILLRNMYRGETKCKTIRTLHLTELFTVLKTMYMEFNWQMVVVPLGMSPEEKFVTQENQIWFKMNPIQKLLRTAIRVLEDGM